MAIMRKYVCVLLGILFVSCAEKSSPDFWYVKNNSSYDTEISYLSEKETVLSKTSAVINTDEPLNYSCTESVTVIDYEDDTQSSEVEIELIIAAKKEGFHNGEYCRILEFTDNPKYSKNCSVVYKIQNPRKNQISVHYTYLGVEKTATVPAASDNEYGYAEFLFRYEKPALHFFDGSFAAETVLVAEDDVCFVTIKSL